MADEERTADSDLLDGYQEAGGSYTSSPEQPGQSGVAQQAGDDSPGSESDDGLPEPQQELDPIKEQFGLSAEEIRQRLAKAEEAYSLKARYEQDLARVHGKFGELNRTMQELRKGSGPGALNKGALKRLREEYPEVADLLEEDLTAAFSPASPPSQPDTGQQQGAQDPMQEFDARLRTAVSQITDMTGMQMLTFLHPDWQQAKASPEFEQWKLSQPQEVRQQFETSRDAAWAAQQLTAFKNWLKTKSANESNRNRRLESALQPEGTPQQRPPGPSAHDAFLAGFREERGTR